MSRFSRRSLLAGGVGICALQLGRHLPAATTDASLKPQSIPRSAQARQAGPFWPDGIRMVVSISLQFETGALGVHDGGPVPAIDPKYDDNVISSWYAYGIQEGVPRLLDLFERRRVRVTSHMLGKAVDSYPSLAKEIVTRGHEASGHGQTGAPVYLMTPTEESAEYQANVDSLLRAAGTRPVGMNAAGMRHTPATLAILQRGGFIYHVDDVSRDEPFTVSVNSQPFAVVPYTLRNNDLLRYGDPGLTGGLFASELKAEFDQLYDEAATRRRMMSVTAHDRISGTPDRVRALEQFISYAQGHPGVAFLRKVDIARLILAERT